MQVRHRCRSHGLADPALDDYVAAHRRRAAPHARAGGRPLPRRVDEGDRARARRRAPAALGARCSRVAAAARAAARAVPRRARVRRRRRGARASSPASTCTAARSPRCTGPTLPDPADLLRDARRVVVLEDIVDHTNVGAIFRSGRGARRRRGARDAALRRSALPAERPGQHGHGAAGAVDAPAGVARRPRRCCTTPASRSRRSPSPTTRWTSTCSQRTRPSGSRSCSAPRATGSAGAALAARRPVGDDPDAARRRLAERRRGGGRRALGARCGDPHPGEPHDVRVSLCGADLRCAELPASPTRRRGSSRSSS